MPSGELFRYNQIISFVRSKLNRLDGPLVLTYFELSCQTRGLLRGRISTIYTILTDPGTKLPYMNQWERGLNATLELSDWQDTAYALSKISINTTLFEANYKTLLRWYLVPTRVAKMHPSASPTCFRRCGQMGTMFHVWWQCPVVTRFWIRIFNLVYSVTGVNIRRSLEPALFQKLPDEVAKKLTKLIVYIFLAARITIAKYWKQSMVPLDYVKNKLNWIMVNDRLTCVLRNSTKKFDATWEPWICYLSTPYSDSG